MNRESVAIARWACILLSLFLGLTNARADDKIALGDAFPPYQFDTMSGQGVDSAQASGKVRVLIYVIADQRGSERAIADASKAVGDMNNPSIDLLFVTANTDRSDSFAEFWEEKSIEGTLAFDRDRALYTRLGLISFPSTFIIDREGNLAHSLSTHSPNYPHVLEGYIRHALGTLDDAGLAEHLKARNQPTNSPRSIASRHRAVARLMRSKGLDENAEEELREALKNDPQNPDVKVDLAELCLDQRRFSEASEFIEQALDEVPEHRHAMLLMGILLFEQGDYEQARQWLTRALAHNPDPTRTRFYLGRVCEALGDKDQALEHYRQALGRLIDEPAE